MFYPADKSDLEKTCRGFLDRAKGSTSELTAGTPLGIIAPHAGYQYSGFTAAHGYSLLAPNRIRTVIVISPSHREYFDGISVFSGKAYSTPLGEVEVDNQLREAFLETAGESVIESRAGHKTEHALEVQIPFLQVTLGSFKILPVVMGDQDRRYCEVLGMTLADIITPGSTLIVASSDLSHYHDYVTANSLDRICTEDVTALDPDKLLSDLQAGRCEACGGGPIASLLYAAKKLGKTTSRSLHHCNSGDMMGDKSAVVGYLSAIVS